MTTVLPAVQRRARGLLGPQLLQAAHRVSRARSSWCSRRSGSATAAAGGWCRRSASSRILFLLVSFGGHTPFYRLWYEVMPMMKKVRAPGMAFFLVALPVAAFAGFGTDRLLAAEVHRGARSSCRSACSAASRCSASSASCSRWRPCSPPTGAGRPGRRQRRRAPGRVAPAARRRAGRRRRCSGRCGADGSRGAPPRRRWRWS